MVTVPDPLPAQRSDAKISGLGRYSQRYQCGGTLPKAVLQSINVGEAGAVIKPGPLSIPKRARPRSHSVPVVPRGRGHLFVSRKSEPLSGLNEGGPDPSPVPNRLGSQSNR